MNPFKVLIVDDSEDLAGAMCQFLSSKTDAEFTICSSGEEAVDVLETEPFNLVITDLQMPSGNGLKVIEKARAHGVEVIVHSGMIRAYEHHLPEDVTLLEKPSRLHDVLRLINSFREKAIAKRGA